MKNNVCGKCGKENEITRYFCSECGAFLAGDMISDESVYELPEMKVMRILDNLKHVPHHKTMWEDTDDLFKNKILKVERLEAMYGLPDLKEKRRHDVSENLSRFLDKCYNPEFQIAFVGTIKTGKSTLINSLLGHNYASMAVTPETAALTKFRASSQDFITVKFYNDAEWKKLWASRTNAEVFMREWNELNAESKKDEYIGRKDIHKEIPNDEIENELARWSSSKSAEHYFVKEIEVGISSLAKDFPKEVVFVDTPGLSDPVAYRSEITSNYIKKADAVFMCIDAQKIHKAEIETIEGVFSNASQNKDKVHIIATHWDKLNDPISDWEDHKSHLKKQLTGKAFFDTEEMAASHIMHSAAFVYNLIREFKTLSEDEKEEIAITAAHLKIMGRKDDLDDYIISKLTSACNIDSISNIIKEKLSGKYQEILMQDLEILYTDLLQKISVFAKEGKTDTQKLIDMTLASKEKIEKAIAEHKKHFDDIKQQGERLDSLLKIAKKKTKKNLNDVLAWLDGKKNNSH